MDASGRPRNDRSGLKRSRLGTAPGTLLADESALETKLTVFAVSETDRQRFDDISVDDVERLRAEWSMVWLDCVGLRDVDAIARIGEIFGLHRLAIEDVVNAGQRPKADFYDDHVFVVLNMVDDVASSRFEQISIFFSKNFVITFQERPGDCFDPVRKRLANNSERIHKRKADYLAYALMDTIVDSYFLVTGDFGRSVDRLEADVVGQRRRRQMGRLHDLRRRTVAIKRQLLPMRDALSALIRTDVPFVAAETKIYLADAHDHAVQLIEMVETYRDTITSLSEMYLALGQARTNDVIGYLTIVSVIFMPLTFLVGIWGMNFDPDTSPWNMPELRAYYGYPAALVFMAAVAFGMIAFFKWKKWL